MSLELIHYLPTTTAKEKAILFVHGAWHGAWCWEKYFMPYFAQHGYHTYALSLRGHAGTPPVGSFRWTSIHDYVTDVAQAIRQLPHPPILVGHSMGGFIVQKYLEQHELPLAFLLASVPSFGAIKIVLKIIRHYPISFLQTGLQLRLFPIIKDRQITKRLLFSENVPAQLYQSYYNRLGDEAYRAFLDMLFLNLPQPQRVTSPVLVIGAANDWLIPLADVQTTATAYHTHAKIFPNMAHDIMLEPNWQLAADWILAQISVRGF